MTARARPNGLIGAIQFLTRVPLRSSAAADPAATIAWFPVVGALIGTVVGLVAAGAMHVVAPTVAASLAVLTGVALTGAFHEDGLADTCDAMGGWTTARRREILLDSRLGTYGVAALAGSILVRVASVATLGPAAALAAPVAAHAVGRGAAVAVMASAAHRRSARPDGLGADHIHSLSGRRAAAAGVATVAIGAVAIGWWLVPATVAVALGAAVVVVVARRALEGINGDVLGAVEQVGECLVLVVVSGLASRSGVWWA
ncbi:adenosylcobinamide-GDP ribazoletransferase [Ilumatobacter sp.]|uniref:adenosylcobinamide-GDP ribazoletransferase n=1 Tax=Ilumatobacter sp. TaxID=1967498 RepID=UPI003B52A2C6